MSATTTQPTKLDVYRGQLLSPGNMAELKRTLPAHVPVERFERNIVNVLMSRPDLLDTDPRLLWRECAKAAALGLLLDPHLGEAYLVDAFDGKLGRKAVQLRIGYRGLIKLARQSGEIVKVYARAVHQGDQVECVLGLQETLVHRPQLFGDRGVAVGYYAVAIFDDGNFDFEPMSISEINAVRDKSDGYRAYMARKIKDTPWASSYDEMAKKTAIRRLLKRLPQSPDLADAHAIDDREELVQEEPAAQPQRKRSSRMDTIRATVDSVAEDITGQDLSPGGDQGGAEPADEPQDGAQASQQAEQTQEAATGAQPAQAAAQGGAEPSIPRRQRPEPEPAVDNAPQGSLEAWANGGQ